MQPKQQSTRDSRVERGGEEEKKPRQNLDQKTWLFIRKSVNNKPIELMKISIRYDLVIKMKENLSQL